MKQQIPFTMAVGRPLTGYAFGPVNGQLLLVFGDYYVCLGVERGYESGDESINEEPLAPLDFGDDYLLGAGVFSVDELTAMKEAKNNEYKARREAQERKMFEELRAKYESEQSDQCTPPQ